jgi:hypothetical protein
MDKKLTRWPFNIINTKGEAVFVADSVKSNPLAELFAKEGSLDSDLSSLICRLLQLLMKLLFHYLRQSCVLILNRDYEFSFEIQVVNTRLKVY